MTVGTRLSIGVLLPDVLGTYSDAGNAVVLARRAGWAGISADVVSITAELAPPTTCDIYVIGGGEDLAQAFAAGWLAQQRGLRTALDGSATVLAVCAGFQIIGTDFTDPRGVRHAGISLIDASTVQRSRRAVGQVVAQCVVPAVGLLSGFENHGGATRLGPGAAPLAHVLSGCGNGSDRDGQVRAEGVLAPRLVATYLHGPVLARNPALADHLLATVLGSSFTPPALDLIPDAAAMRASYLGRPENHSSLVGTVALPPRTRDGRAHRDGARSQLLRRLALVVLLLAAVVGMVLALLGIHA